MWCGAVVVVLWWSFEGAVVHAHLSSSGLRSHCTVGAGGLMGDVLIISKFDTPIPSKHKKFK